MKRIVLAAIPDGMPRETDFATEVVSPPLCPEGGILVSTQWISVDPYLRGRMTGNRSYIDPIPVGSAMESGAVGEVLESQFDGLKPGDTVTGMWGWQELATPNPKAVLKIDPKEAPPSTAIGILGMPGMTAYFGFLELCQPKPGETVVVSGAAGAVGSAVGQIAKIIGCHVVGTAGSAAKCDYIRSLGFDAAINYKTDKPYKEKLKELCPNGIDCYFDNVGGEMTDAVLQLMNVRGRIAICGQISQYNDRAQDVGPRPYWQFIVRQLRLEGFLVSRWFDRWPEGRKQMALWLKEGRLRFDETVYEGLESAPKAFIGLFLGENTGKAIVRL